MKNGKKNTTTTKYKSKGETTPITDNDLCEIFLKFQRKEVFSEKLTRMIYLSILRMKCDRIIQV